MNVNVKSVVEECSKGSEDDTLNFPQQLAKLAAVGVEGYYADLRGARKIYYTAVGGSIDVNTTPLGLPVDHRFDAGLVEAAVRQSQAGTHTYREFCAKIMAAGCPGYLVSIPGRRVVYFGRTAECHVEHFPQ